MHLLNDQNKKELPGNLEVIECKECNEQFAIRSVSDAPDNHKDCPACGGNYCKSNYDEDWEYANDNWHHVGSVKEVQST